jgi:hydrogenase maturation protease
VDRILIAGLGDKLRGDDGLGVFVIDEFKKKKLPENVDVEDYGTGIFGLIDKLNKYDKIILIDAIKKGGKPGEIYKLELNKIEDKKFTNLHELKIDKLVLVFRSLGINLKIIFIGCEPKSFDLGVGLSKEVEKAIPKIIDLIISSL